MPKSKFADLKKYDPRGQRAWYTLPIEARYDAATDRFIDPRIELVHAGQTNKPYTNAVMKINARTGTARRIAQGRADVSILEDNLNIDRELFPSYVVKGWSGIFDTDGKEVPYSTEACKEFLVELPDWIMQELSTFAARPINFLPDDMPTNEEVDEQAGK